MKKYKINSETILALGSMFCLLFMKYYETALYYRNINIILNLIYSFVAIPLFYFFLSSCFATIVVKLFSIQVSKLQKRIFKLTDILCMIIYIVFLVLKLFGYITIGYMPFISRCWIAFIAWGCIFAIDADTQ
ncbi:hypothetical protein [Clostridium sp. HBUAS56010]|uniref:hypothetical protein n=1 Tax=Clostridium sp. HBUAS56010 TaxID=2571127 RepID=UPI0011780F77|nr:hypothetical protein [Clostridium sp. HBUAS56010]